MTKQELTLKVNIIIEDLKKILSNEDLINSKELRLENNIKVFTKECPLSEYGDIFRYTRTFPWKENKFKREYLERRLLFWEHFIECVKKITSEDAEYDLNWCSFVADAKSYYKLKN